jgi:hypothetical protein
MSVMSDLHIWIVLLIGLGFVVIGLLTVAWWIADGMSALGEALDRWMERRKTHAQTPDDTHQTD